MIAVYSSAAADEVNVGALKMRDMTSRESQWCGDFEQHSLLTPVTVTLLKQKYQLNLVCKFVTRNIDECLCIYFQFHTKHGNLQVRYDLGKIMTFALQTVRHHWKTFDVHLIYLTFRTLIAKILQKAFNTRPQTGNVAKRPRRITADKIQSTLDPDELMSQVRHLCVPQTRIKYDERIVSPSKNLVPGNASSRHRYEHFQKWTEN